MVTKKDSNENDDKNDVVLKRDPEIVKRETAELAKKTAELTKKGTGEFGKRYTQLIYEYNFTKEEIAWLVVFLLVILAPMVLPEQFLNDNQVSILLFVVAPVMGWFIRLIYLDEKRQRKIR